jgi:RNA polymerase sigma factor (sigma-70 family)
MLDDVAATTEVLTDEEVLALSLSRPSYFSVLVARYEEPFIGKAKKIIRDEELAKDIVQETFVKIYTNGGRFRVQENASFKSWAYTILVNTAFTYYKKHKRDREHSFVPEDEVYMGLADEKSLAFEGQHMLTDFIASILVRMPADLSRALKMHFIEGLPHKEIADAEGLTVGAVKSRIHRAKAVFNKIHKTLESKE